jgi:hypothetical protein
MDGVRQLDDEIRDVGVLSAVVKVGDRKSESLVLDERRERTVLVDARAAPR